MFVYNTHRKHKSNTWYFNDIDFNLLGFYFVQAEVII